MIRRVMLVDYEKAMRQRQLHGKTTRTFLKIGRKVYETTGATLGQVGKFQAEQARLADAQTKLFT